MLQSLQWTGQSLRLIDLTRLSGQIAFLEINDAPQMRDAIKRRAVREVPALAAAAAFGAYLGIRHFDGDDAQALLAHLDEVCACLRASLPNDINLRAALLRIRKTASDIAGGPCAGSLPPCRAVRDIQEAVLDECLRMMDEGKCL